MSPRTFYVVTGCVVDADAQKPVEGLLVEAYDHDCLSKNDLLGGFTTNDDGTFEISFTQRAAEGGNGEVEWTPEPYLMVYANEGEDIVGTAATHTGDEYGLFEAGVIEVDLEGLEEESRHGMAMHRGMTVGRSCAHQSGRFQRFFPELPPHTPADELLVRLGEVGGPMSEGEDPATESSIPAGFTFFGQFIDHDITLDTESSLDRQADLDALSNFRTPVLELDNVYRAGPEADPYLYEHGPRGGLTGKLHFGTDQNPDDLQRNKGNRAIIGDPRNDENGVIAQFHLAVIKFHNAVVDYLVDEEGMEPGEEVFEEAQRLVRWHYQWCIVNDFLPRIVGPDLVDELVASNAAFQLFHPEGPPYIPVEFSVAAYRYGHSQLRLSYRLNDDFEGDLFPDPRDRDANVIGMGFEPVPPEKVVKWKYFFDIEDDVDPQPGKQVDEKLPRNLLDLPFMRDPRTSRSSLAARNLLRGKRFELPSGQDVAKRLGIEDRPSMAELCLDEIGFDEAPLWYYVLKEGELQGQGQKGDGLGPVGSRIVGETLLGLLKADPMSYLVANPCFTPKAEFTIGSDPESFGVADLVDYGADQEPPC